ncbi:MAG: type I secretion system permease/ATPase [Halioglobus sp.]
MSQPNPLKQVLAPLRGAMTWTVVFSLCINLLMLTVPLYLLQLFDRVLTSRSLDTLWVLTSIALVALVTYGVLEALRRLLLSRTGRLIEERTGPGIFQASLQAAPESAGMASAHVLRDLTTLRNFFAGSAIIPLLDAPWSIIFLVVIFLLHPTLGWLALGAFLLLFLVAVLNEKLTREALRQAAEASAASNQSAENTIENSEVVLALGMTRSVVGIWQELLQQALSRWEEGNKLSSQLASVSKVLRLMLQISVLGVGAVLVITGSLTAGGMIAASILVTRALAPIDQLISSWSHTVAARKAYDSVQAELEKPVARQSETALPAPSGLIQVEGMSYVHPGQQEPILKTIGFSLKPGESLGLIGPTGSGKTTLARLLLGVLKPRLGTIRLDGMNLSEWPESDRGQYIGYLPQDLELFAGSVAKNIARFTDSDSEAIVNAAKLAGAHEMILQLPQGYDTPVGPRGVTLSGGQRQRIALARAVFGDIRFIVLDEPNANQDRAGEMALMRALKQLKEQRITSVVIAHRPAIIEYVDKVLVLRDGKIEAFGAKDEVLSRLATPTPNPQDNKV